MDKLTCHEELGVRMVVNEHLYSLVRLGRLQPVDKGRGLWGIRLRRALEVVGTGVGRGTPAETPLEWPVTVDIVPDAAAARGALSVLAPHPIVGLGVEEAVRVDDGEHVEVVLVNEGLDLGRRSVVGQEVVRHELDRHCRDPFTRVNRTVQDNGRLRALAGASPEVDSRDGVAVERASRRDDRRLARVLRLEISQELKMVAVGMVRVEPSAVHGSGCWLHIGQFSKHLRNIELAGG